VSVSREPAVAKLEIAPSPPGKPEAPSPPSPEGSGGGAEVVRLDRFRKK
jgi:hypothetical protein